MDETNIFMIIIIQEFQAWLIEIKKADIMTLPQSKRKEMFIDFMDGKKGKKEHVAIYLSDIYMLNGELMRNTSGYRL